MAMPACKRSTITKHEYMYVSAIETSLRDRVATMYNKVGTVHNGDRVDVLEHQRRFVRVRTDAGVEGWIEQRSLVTQEIFDGFQKLEQDAKGMAGQGHGTTRAELNMHITPSRDGEHLYLLKDGEKVEILKRATTDRNAPKPQKPAPPPKAPPKAKEEKPSPAETALPAAAKPPSAPTVTLADKTPVAAPAPDNGKPAEPPKQVMEDWYLVRNSAGQVGWVLMRMVDLDVPLDVAQYAEGQRIVGYFILNTVPETIDGEEKQEPQYLMLLEPAQRRPALRLQPGPRVYPQSQQAPLRNCLPRARHGRLFPGQDRPRRLRQRRRPADLHHSQDECRPARLWTPPTR